MGTVGRYCKAYSLKQLRAFKGWSENLKNARPEAKAGQGEGPEEPRALTDEDFLYLHENYAVTDSVFLDKHVIFDGQAPGWVEFCTNELKFQIPEYLRTSESGKQAEK